MLSDVASAAFADGCHSKCHQLFDEYDNTIKCCLMGLVLAHSKRGTYSSCQNKMETVTISNHKIVTALQLLFQCDWYSTRHNEYNRKKAAATVSAVAPRLILNVGGLWQRKHYYLLQYYCITNLLLLYSPEFHNQFGATVSIPA